jgi:SAM-dependent methyltransferase
MNGIQDWLRRQALRWPPLYRMLRSLKRTLVPSLAADAFRARIEVQEPLHRFQVAENGLVEARVTNASSRAWPGGQLALSYHWRRPDGSVWGFDGRRTPLASPLAPGGTTTVTCTVTPPNTPGSYVLEMDLVDGSDGWFSRHGSPVWRRDVVVAGMRPENCAEIDYEQIYGQADLKKDFWSVVGPASAEEFRQLGRGKLEMLKSLGLTPRSRVLDVGCGTGSLAEAAAGFLDDAGLYYGTDLSEVAVRYCRENYPRPNFVFARNEMTAIPIDGQRFDFIVFFSVFTHTYPQETRALLTEAMRLLADGGSIVADVFEADIEGDSLGTRAMLVLDRGRVPALAGELGLEARTLSEFVWDGGGERRIDRVMRLFSKPAAALSG